jgi:DNA-binding transcriptional MerR regulator
MATYRQLDHWVRKGYLHPENPEPGSGSVRRFSVDAYRAFCAARAAP